MLSGNVKILMNVIVLSLGEMIAKKPGADLDGAPFVTGIFTLLKQFHSEITDQFLAVMGQYVRSLVEGSQR